LGKKANGSQITGRKEPKRILGENFQEKKARKRKRHEKMSGEKQKFEAKGGVRNREKRSNGSGNEGRKGPGPDETPNKQSGGRGGKRWLKKNKEGRRRHSGGVKDYS